MAFLRGPILSRVLSVWAENWYENSLGQDKALTKFSAQTDSPRLRIGPRENAKIDFFRNLEKSAKKRKVVEKGQFFDQKRKILHRFLSQLMLTIYVSFEQFVWNFNFFDPKSALLTTFFLGRCQQKSRFWGPFWRVLVGPNKLLKMHVLGQNELNKRFKHTRAPKSAQKCLFETVLVLGKNHR